MKKTILTLTAVTLAAAATPAVAGTITAEVRLADVRGGQAPDSTEYRVEYFAPANSLINYGAELQVKQKNNEGPLTSLISAKVGPAIPDVLGFKTNAYAEVGAALSEKVTTRVGNVTRVTGGNDAFSGAAVKVSRPVYGPVSVNLGYRHREGFGSFALNENRLNGGLTLAMNDANSVGVTYYRTTGTTRADAIGVGLNHKF